MKNNKGFSAIEALIVLVVIGLLGATRWYVMNQRTAKQNKAAADTNSNADINSKDNKSVAPTPVVSQKPTEDSHKTADTKYYTIQVPKEWVVKEDGEWTYFTSTDFKAPEGVGPTALAGYKLEVRVSKSESGETYEKLVEDAKEGQKNHGGTYRTVTIDGNNAVISDTKTHGTYIYATTYKGGNTIYLRLHAIDEDDPAVIKLFDELLATVKLK